MSKKQTVPAAIVLAVVLGSIAAAVQDKKPGYTDTPVIPGSKFKVHDADRPHPKIITPAGPSTQDRPGAPPSDAIVLFDGKDLSKWSDSKGNPSGWNVKAARVPRTTGKQCLISSVPKRFYRGAPCSP